jgi:6-phosphofructokinase 1
MAMRVGVLTGGGDCPGLNAVIRAVTKSLLHHGQCEVLGIADGFDGLMGSAPRSRVLGWEQVSGIAHLGGTILGTSNSANPLRDAATLAQVGRNVQALGLPTPPAWPAWACPRPSTTTSCTASAASASTPPWLP